jgi:hypothetical protein
MDPSGKMERIILAGEPKPACSRSTQWSASVLPVHLTFDRVSCKWLIY